MKCFNGDTERKKTWKTGKENCVKLMTVNRRENPVHDFLLLSRVHLAVRFILCRCRTILTIGSGTSRGTKNEVTWFLG